MDDISRRLDAVGQRVAALARLEAPGGLTEPDPGGTERWEAAQVWAHMAEFVGYWRDQLEGVVRAYTGEPVPFGRTKIDPDRIAAIDRGRHEPIEDLSARVSGSVGGARRYLDGLTAEEWKAVGRHPTRGDVDVAAIVEHFIVDHLEEHADQLDSLR